MDQQQNLGLTPEEIEQRFRKMDTLRRRAIEEYRDNWYAWKQGRLVNMPNYDVRIEPEYWRQWIRCKENGIEGFPECTEDGPCNPWRI